MPVEGREPGQRHQSNTHTRTLAQHKCAHTNTRTHTRTAVSAIGEQVTVSGPTDMDPANPTHRARAHAATAPQSESPLTLAALLHTVEEPTRANVGDEPLEGRIAVKPVNVVARG